MDLVKAQEILSLVGAVAIGLPALLSALIAFFVLVPGAQPEKFLQGMLDKVQKVVDVIAKFSKK